MVREISIFRPYSERWPLPTEPTLSESELLDPYIVTRPMNFSNWRLRVMILEFSRRCKVMAGRKDPTPFEPWLVCDPADLKAWIAAHSTAATQKATAEIRATKKLAAKAGSKKRKL